MVGVGLNVTWPVMADDPGDGDAAIEPALAEVAGLATALNWLGAEVDRVDLLVAFLRGLEDRYAGLVADGPDALLAAWRERSATLGRRVRVDLGADEVEGTAVDVTGDGHLVVETPEGDRRTLAVGDVVHLRPALTSGVEVAGLQVGQRGHGPLRPRPVDARGAGGRRASAAAGRRGWST